MKGIVIDHTIGDIDLSQGAILIADVDGQNIESILRANRGDFKEVPLVGGEVYRIVHGQPSSMWCALIKKQIQSVGIAVSRVEVANGEIKIQ